MFVEKVIRYNSSECPLKWGSAARKGPDKRVSEDSQSFHFEDEHYFLGVFDGHGSEGKWVSSFLASRWFEYLDANKFPALDEELKDKFTQYLKRKELPIDTFGGSTAACVVLDPMTISIIHLGDSRIVVGDTYEIVYATKDHKAKNKEEAKRMKGLHFILDGDGYICTKDGSLGMSRSFGDYAFKKEGNVLVSNIPTVEYLTMDPSMTYTIIIASDGIWDMIENKEAYKFIQDRRAQGFTPLDAANALVDRCEASSDDITCIVIFL